MSLSLDLTTLPGSSYLPRPEFFAPGNNYVEDERKVWDILGTYTPSIGVITLYEDEIMKCAQSISNRPERIYPIIRELVRLHEHAHAYIHTSVINMHEKWKPVNPGWFDRLPMDVSESLAEYVVVTLLESSSTYNSWLNIFMEVDAKTPPYYQKWKQTRNLNRHIYCVSPTIGYCRTSTWKDWDDFYAGLTIEKDKIIGLAEMYKLI